MRILALLLLTVSLCRAQSEESKVEALLKRMERAEQTGDFDAWQALWIPEKASEMETLRSHVKARPEVQYRSTRTFVRGGKAVLLVQGASKSYVVMTLRKDGGEWKFEDQIWRDTAPDSNFVYALAPPVPGAFARAGSPWNRIPPGVDPKKATREGWQMKAAFDENYLYIRIESQTDLPAPGSTIATPPGGWPILKIDVSGAGEFVLLDAVNVGDQATFDEHGKANSHRPFAVYSIRLERDHHEIFSASADLHPSTLVEVSGRDYDIRIPLELMGVRNSRATRITIGDAQWPNSAVLSFAARRYPQ